jgi:hypothetical protein
LVFLNHFDVLISKTIFFNYFDTFKKKHFKKQLELHYQTYYSSFFKILSFGFGQISSCFSTSKASYQYDLGIPNLGYWECNLLILLSHNPVFTV